MAGDAKGVGGPICTMRGMRMKNSSNLGDGREIVDGRKFPRAFFK